MNIKDLGPPPANGLETQDSQKKTVATGPEKAKDMSESPAKPGETVRLSNEAQDIRKIEQNLAQLPEVDKERVEKLRQMIADGNYTTNSRNVALKMLSLEKVERDF